LALMLLHRTVLKVYFVLVLVGILYLGFDTYQTLQDETDCGAGCAMAVGAVVLTTMIAVVGSGLAALSVFVFNKWRRKAQ
jgi:type III secretory pathway component EscU